MVNKKGNRQIERTRNAIVDAYLELLNKSSSKKIKITEICHRANISRPTFYNHFQTKDEILLAHLDEIIEEMFIEYRELQFQSEEEAFSNFEAASAQFFKLWQSKSDLYNLIKDVQAERLLINKLKDHHMKTYHIIAKHNFPINDPEILDYFISHISYVFFSVLDQWMRCGLKRSPEEMGKLLAILYRPLVIKGLSERYNQNSPL
jgi:AcrR family transcriptional regulator